LRASQRKKKKNKIAQLKKSGGLFTNDDSEMRNMTTAFY
jgi:hypothetical protein